MKEISTDQLLQQLRINAAQASGVDTQNTAIHAPKGGPEFSDLLVQSINKVNELQQQSGQLGKAFELGDESVSLAEVMIAKQKAGIAFQSVLQVRNKLLNAYKEVMSMPV